MLTNVVSALTSTRSRRTTSESEKSSLLVLAMVEALLASSLHERETRIVLVSMLLCDLRE